MFQASCYDDMNSRHQLQCFTDSTLKKNVAQVLEWLNEHSRLTAAAAAAAAAEASATFASMRTPLTGGPTSAGGPAGAAAAAGRCTARALEKACEGGHLEVAVWLACYRATQVMMHGGYNTHLFLIGGHRGDSGIGGTQVEQFESSRCVQVSNSILNLRVIGNKPAFVNHTLDNRLSIDAIEGKCTASSIAIFAFCMVYFTQYVFIPEHQTKVGISPPISAQT